MRWREAPGLAILPSGGCWTRQQHWRHSDHEPTPTDSADLRAAWEAVANAALEEKPRRAIDTVPEQYLILVTCRDERQQVEMLERFQREGMECKALLS
jgi:hypothetical protein